MQMKPIAAGLASLGRNNDSMLVHMTPGEVHGLQRLALAHGGSLTINPHTGLPEAGFLSSILPMAAGVALNAFMPGAGLPFLGSPLGAGLLVGGIGALASGSLQKGLLAGLGAYGGAGLGAGLMNVGSEVAKDAVMQQESQLAAQKLAQETAQRQMEQQAAMAAATPPPPPPNTMGLPSDYNQTIAEHFARVNAPVSVPPVQPPVPVDVSMSADLARQAITPAEQAVMAQSRQVANMTPLEKMSQGLGYFTEKPMDAASKLIGQAASKKEGTPQTGLGGLGGAAMTAGAAAAPFIASKMAADQKAAYAKAQQQGLGSTAPAEYYHTRFNPVTRMYEGPNQFTSTYPYAYATGGSIPPMATNYPQSNITPSTYATSFQSPQPSEVFDEYGPRINPFTGEQRMAGGGIAEMHEYAAGGRLLNGPGDGMSDSIPAVIKGQKPQRAALADGEFVIPSDVVSHLGNGSTKAGAKRLYDMMDRVRTARVGTKKQGKQINPNKFMPA